MSGLPHQHLPVLGLDTETTGVDVKKDRIVTAAIVHRAADGTITERTWLLQPDIDIPPRATAIHGISTEYARQHGQERTAGLDEIASALTADAAPTLLAFNAPFDLGILAAELRRVSLPGLAERLGRPVGPVLDPLVIDRAIWPRRRGKRTLVDVAEAYGANISEDLHDALGDIRTTIAALDAMLASPYAQAAGLGDMTMDELHAWQVKSRAEWAADFNRWLRSQGRTPNADPTWP
ncbi:MAG: DNA polymerase III subunit epsilon [Bifidobacteriaceae bacterium]|jgi:DNA polymerase-3 subunit epsilon|nr:DNA polymerase III subunit epsilon [Bifidobacteriaceae bacterium]